MGIWLDIIAQVPRTGFLNWKSGAILSLPSVVCGEYGSTYRKAALKTLVSSLLGALSNMETLVRCWHMSRAIFGVQNPPFMLRKHSLGQVTSFGTIVAHPAKLAPSLESST